MSRFNLISMASIIASVTLAPAAARAAERTALTCSVAVDYSLDNVSELSYTRDFAVSAAAPFAEDFSTATRSRTFNASVTLVDGVPQVAISFFADVSVFNAVAFDATLKVRDRNGDATSGDSQFVSSATGAAGAHRTTYTLDCRRARN